MDSSYFKAYTVKLKHDLERFADVGAPEIAGKTAADLFTKNFQNESFFGDEWAEVNRRKDTYTVRGKVRKNYTKGAARKRKILTGQTADLGRSIDYDVKGNGVVEVFSDKDYASYHNEGISPQPQRQFIGDSPEVEQAVEKELERKLNQIFGI